MGSEARAIEAVSTPSTARSLRADLARLGVRTGDIVLVHAAMSRLGWVVGGAHAVVEALLESVGPSGTIVMPTQSMHLSDPSGWSNPPVPAAWFDLIRAEMPAFDRHLTPCPGMGRVVDCLRGHPNSVRSDHPLLSFCANGAEAGSIVGSHPLTPALGLASPLQRLYDLDASVLLLGVGHDASTALHLAEHLATWPSKHSSLEAVPLLVDGVRQWVTYEDLELDESDFEQIGDAFAHTGEEQVGRVGAGDARLFPVRTAVDFAVDWMTTNRT